MARTTRIGSGPCPLTRCTVRTLVTEVRRRIRGIGIGSVADEHERTGGLAAWGPRGARAGVDLTPAQELADRAAPPRRRRVVREPDRPHHACSVGRRLPREPVGAVVARGARRATSSPSTPTAPWSTGAWDVTPAVHIHTELHRRRADAAVVVHNHPPYASALAAIGELPELVHQNSSILADELVLVTDYDGEVDQPDARRRARRAHRRRVGRAAREPRRDRHRADDRARPSTSRCCSSARACCTGSCGRWTRSRSRSRRRTRSSCKASLVERAAPVYWHGVVRQLVARRARGVGVDVAIPLEELQAQAGLHHRRPRAGLLVARARTGRRVASP